MLPSPSSPTPGATSWPLTFPQQHLAPDEALEMWSVVRHVRQHHRRLYRKFLSQWTIYDVVVDYLAQATAPTLAGLVNELEKRGKQETTWLVDIPLLNLAPPRETVPLGPRAMLVRSDQVRRQGRRFGPYLRDIWAVKHHLGDELTPRNRWLQASGAREVDVDTRMTASLLLVEDGIEELAVNLAETRARLALAMWCLLSPPRLAHDPRQPWPTVGGWTPAPHIEFGLQRKLYEPGPRFGRAQRRGNRITLDGVDAQACSLASVRSRFALVTQEALLFSATVAENLRVAKPDATQAELETAARVADAHGFNAVWTPERHFHAFGGPYPNPSVTGAAIAAVTHKVEIRAGSCVVPLHHPARVAEEWSVIDNLSNGRVGISFASGWMPEDFLLRPENAPPLLAVGGEARGADELRQFPRGEAAHRVHLPEALLPVDEAQGRRGIREIIARGADDRHAARIAEHLDGPREARDRRLPRLARERRDEEGPRGDRRRREQHDEDSRAPESQSDEPLSHEVLSRGHYMRSTRD